MQLNEAFLNAKNEEMNLEQLRNAFEDILKIKMLEEEFNILFRKINMKGDGNVTWDEFISYLLLEFQEKDTGAQWQSLELPITGSPQMLRSYHRTPICKISFCPEDRSISFQRGNYITVSRDGAINYWSVDLQYERSVRSKNPYLKVQPTAITDMIVMPDVQIICTSSTEYDLRFYDTVANKFDLRVLISSLEYAVVCMYYYFSTNVKEDSYIILGDTNGSIKILTFSPLERGPFKHEVQHDMLGELRGMKVTELKNVHTNWVSQVAYYGSLRAFMSCSRCPSCSLLFRDTTGTRAQYKFNVAMGITCFTFCEENQMLVTGGPDCTIRIWNPFVPRKASAIFQGHRATICALVVQNDGKQIYSLSNDRCVKVWDVPTQSCIQIVSTGTDSCIIVWDPWLGRRLNLIKNAHSQLMLGQYMNIAITAACFDNSEHLLVTGAQDGSLKMWNFNTGICIRNMMIENHCEVTSIVWLENRILCAGWNHRVTEFALSNDDTHKKEWEARHTDDILCAAAYFPQVLATATYNGELILWRLETGIVLHVRYSIRYRADRGDKVKELAEVKETVRKQQRYKKHAYSTDCTQQQSALSYTRIVAVRAMIFLTARVVGPNTGTLLVSLDSGLIQVWSHHPAGGFLEAFSVVHILGDAALALATDEKNDFLITGHSAGYIKVWLLTNYMIPNPNAICMPLLRLEFPFLWKDKLSGRAKRAVQGQSLPLLVSSVRGHTNPVTSVQTIDSSRIIVSGSGDHTVRLWTFGQRYISTLGTFKKWTPILSTLPVQKYFRNYRLPPDIKRFGSFTTMKVLHGGLVRQSQDENIENAVILRDDPKYKYQQLYNHDSKLKGITYLKDTPILDNTFAHIPIYAHLITHPLEPALVPSLPPRLHKQRIEFTKRLHNKK
ncbi:hypothetical protein KM043_013799 [Ampulex compressa]|nr:hypothetical protein KM043_013799 [Ampulex compressa]